LFFTILGAISGLAVRKYVPQCKFVAQVLEYLALMEGLQVVGYLVIDDCSNYINYWITFFSYMHVCFQPYVLLSADYAEWEPKDKDVARRLLVLVRLALMVGIFLMWRMISVLIGFYPAQQHGREWMMGTGPAMCTYTGNVHLGWSIPLAESTYLIPNISVHNVLLHMGCLTFWDRPEMMARAVAMMLLGPVLAGLMTDNLGEIPAIWCLYSVGAALVGAIVPLSAAVFKKKDE
jgi:hypothetical protein